MKLISKYSSQVKFAAQLTLVITAAAFVCLGVHRGEAGTVLTKAIRLCLECVGIG